MVIKGRRHNGRAVTKWDEPTHGPYRIAEVLPHDNYRLMDLPNRMLHDEFHVSRLTPYPLITNDGERVVSDGEYYVKRIMNRRLVGADPADPNSYEYHIRWLGYAPQHDTWERFGNLGNAMGMVNAFNSLHPENYHVPPLPLDTSRSLPVPATLPHRSEWRTRRARPQPLSAVNEDPPADDSPADVPLPADSAAPAAASPDGPSVAGDAGPSEPVHAASAHNRLRDVHAAKVWFVYNDQLLCYCRSDAASDRPQFDTFGGKMDPADEGSYVTCIKRELNEELDVPDTWATALQAELSAHDQGHALLRLRHPSRNCTHHVATWLVPVDSPTLPELRADGQRESLPGSLGWRHVDLVVANLSEFRFARPTVALLRRACRAPGAGDSGGWTCTSCKSANDGGLFCPGCGLARASFGVDHLQSRRVRIPVTTTPIKSNEQLRATFGKPFAHPYGPFNYRINPSYSDGKGTTRTVLEFQFSRLVGSVRRHVWVYPGRLGSNLTIDEQNRVRAYRLDHPEAQL